MKRAKFLSLLATIASLSLYGAALIAGDTTAKSSPVGVWKTVDDNTGKVRSHIKIWENNGKLYGKILKLIDPPEANPVCDKCQGNLHNKPVEGMTVMKGLKKDGNEWSGGTILDPESGKTYKVLLELMQNGNKLKVRGYIGFSLLGRTQYWHRLK
ncbi:MAG: DUF2147 domain-containing protein [Deltaproteobacteria bacterium]|nr:DUF2147 domain-containing protein [Deltaproteobacteria bacterium]